MATTKKKYKTLSSDPQTRTHEFLVDSVADLDKLPKETGSAALVASIGDIYVCNNAKEWKNISNTGMVETLEPTGTINITENGTVDVTEYATANVNVSNTSDVSGGGGTDLGELVYCFAYLSTSAPARNSSTPDITRPDYAFLGSDMIADTRGINKIAAGIKVGIYNPSVASVSGLYVVTTSSDDDRDWVTTFQEVTGSDISIEEVRIDSMLTQDVITWTMPELQEGECLWIHYDSTD